MLLALDYGERYIGVAITDPEMRLALRHSVIDQKKTEALGFILDLVKKERIAKILVGVPISLEGEETEQTFVSLRFIEHLEELLRDSVEVVSVDETLTSVEAEGRLLREGINKEESHAEAARIILQDYLRAN